MYTGDDVTIGASTFTVQSVTAFFTHGTLFNNHHIALPNQHVLGEVVTNWSSNTTMLLELSVRVRAGGQPCAKVPSALNRYVVR